MSDNKSKQKQDNPTHSRVIEIILTKEELFQAGQDKLGTEYPFLDGVKMIPISTPSHGKFGTVLRYELPKGG